MRDDDDDATEGTYGMCGFWDGNDGAYLSVGVFDQIYLIKDGRVEGHK
jgi:hypothetical protein